VKNKSILPILVLIIAVSFHSVDIFTQYEISESHLITLDAFLAPFGLGGLIRAGHKTYVNSKTTTDKITTEEKKKLVEILDKIKNIE